MWTTDRYQSINRNCFAIWPIKITPHQQTEQDELKVQIIRHCCGSMIPTVGQRDALVLLLPVKLEILCNYGTLLLI